MKGNLKIGIATILILLMSMAFAGSASAQSTGNVTKIMDIDNSNEVVPGETYTAYNFTFNASSWTNAANLTWFNITGWNTSSTNWNGNNASFDDIVNVTLWNATSNEYIGHSGSVSGFNISVNLSNYPVSAGSTANIFVNITLNNTGLIDGKQIAFNASLKYEDATSYYSDWANDTAAETVDTGSFNNVSAISYDSKAQVKVHVNSSAGYDINSTSINLAVMNVNTSNVMWIVKNGQIVNGSAMTNNDLDNSGNASAQVEIALQEGVYNWTTVTNVTDVEGNTIIPNMSVAGFTNFTVNMSGSKMKVIPDDPALQLEGDAGSTENATVNVTVVDVFGNELVFNESDVGVTSDNVTLTCGDSSVSIDKVTSDFFYPNNTKQVQFNVTDSEAETVTLTAYDIGPTGLLSGSADQVFTPRIGGVTVTATDGQLLADGTDYEIVTLQLVADDGTTPVKRSGITVNWHKENATAAGLTYSEDAETNASGMAQINMSATESGVTVTVTGIEGYTGNYYSDSATVNTVAGEPNNTNSQLYVNDSSSDITTGVTVGETLPVSVQVMDSQNNLVEGVEVTLSANTSATFADSTPTTNANGWANTTVTLPTEVNTTMVRAITGSGNTSLTPPELNQTLNVTTNASAVAQLSVSPGKSIGIPNVPGESKSITVQLQDQYGNDNNTASANILITTDNEDLGNMTYSSTTTNNSLWFNITGSDSFTYNVNSTAVDTANLTLNVTTYGFTDTITITTSGPTGLKLLVNDTLPLVGDTVMSTAQLQGPAGDIAISGKSITFTLRNPSNNLVGTYTAATDDDGKVTWNFTQTTLGTYTIKAKNVTYGLSATNTTTYVGNATQITIAVNNTSPQVNDTITVYAIFKDNNGYNSSSVDGDYVKFLADGGQFANKSISNAVASATYTPTSSGELTLDVFYTNDTNPYWDGTVPSASTTITVLAPAGQANITYSDLSVTPTNGTAPLNVTASATVANTGDASGDYNATLKVDGSVVENIVGTLGAGNSTTVSFDYTLDTAGLYNVTIDDLTAVEVNVTEEINEVESVTVIPSSLTLQSPASYDFKANATWTNGTPMDVTKAADWSLNDTSVASISTEGNFSAPLAVNATILVNATYEGVTGSCLLTLTTEAVGPTYAGDLDGDGLFEDVDNNGDFNFGDVVALFNNFDSTQFQEDKQYFDFNQDGNLNFGDVVELFNTL